VRGASLCLHHVHKRALVQVNSLRSHSVALPPLEDRPSIQMAIDEVLAGLAARRLSRREASTKLYGIQLAMQNLSRMEAAASPCPTPADPPPGPPAHPEPSEESSDSGHPAPPCASSDSLPIDPAIPEPAPETESVPAPAQPIDDPGASSFLRPPSPRDTHEYDPEFPLPLTAKQLKDRRGTILKQLGNYRSTLAYYANMPAGTAGMDRDLVLAYVQRNIDELEADLYELDKEAAPDTPWHPSMLHELPV